MCEEKIFPYDKSGYAMGYGTSPYIVKIFVLISDGMCDDPELTNFYRRFCQHIMITSIDREGMNNVMNDNAKK